MRPCKCLYCEGVLNRDTEEYVVAHIKNRYAHKKCADTFNKIHAYCQTVMQQYYVKTKITNNIKELVQNGKSLTGILSTLMYWYDVKHQDPSKSQGGIRIVEYVYPEAMDYYANIQQNKNLNKHIDLTAFNNPETQHIEINPKPVTKPKRVKLFNIQ